MSNATLETPAADSAEAAKHFGAKFAFETDCWDVHETMTGAQPGFVLLDVRSPTLFARGHVPGAINLPHGKITTSKMEAWPRETVFVVYCAGPHCNGADRGALRLARLGRPVKVMIGGVTGWLDEGFELATGDGATQAA
jgi:rhodanese-related sulfurtransferase